ncbi:Xaa-Pro aminopeptidase [Aliamphritea ceti]|uniref:Xaa-Pro aminopeptidase n=1 Tax=Aliamphritea ceti TaxID=1524258 RepID=UPI0021C3DE8C|nr:Xaa-Pro aminopeptidase [Aliamphritea ceti]
MTRMTSIPRDEFAERRQRLLSSLPAGSIALIPAATMQPRNSDVEFPFRQDSDFYYLTGFDEPDALLVLLAGKNPQTVLFCRERDKTMEIWHGYRLGPERAVAELGVDLAFANEEQDKQMPKLMQGCDQIFYGSDKTQLDAQVRSWRDSLRMAKRQGKQVPTGIQQLDGLLHEMRLFKSDAEIAVMREAGRISAAAHCKAMQNCQPGVTEYQLEARLNFHFAMNGCRQPAYPAIVGGGENACVLHYVENSEALKDGDLVLIDAGAELDYYASDITRTFPVSGRFSPEQKALYELVLKAQLSCIDMIKPGVLWQDPHDRSVEILVEGLVELGILKGETEELIKSEAYRDFYMHRLGHWLGMDVHDVGDYKLAGEWRPLQPGMVLTVEPGLYIAPDNTDVDARWRGIGIRIEDDVVVTEDGCEVLSAGVPKQVADIETLMAVQANN